MALQRLQLLVTFPDGLRVGGAEGTSITDQQTEEFKVGDSDQCKLHAEYNPAARLQTLIQAREGVLSPTRGGVSRPRARSSRSGENDTQIKRRVRPSQLPVS